MAMTDRVDSAGPQRRGVRLSASSLYKSGFRGISRQRSTADLSMKWEGRVSLIDSSVVYGQNHPVYEHKIYLKG